MSAAEPTIGDVMLAVRELRVGMLEIRADLADHRLRTAERLDDISRRLGTLTDEIADFWREYREHGPHGEAA